MERYIFFLRSFIGITLLSNLASSLVVDKDGGYRDITIYISHKSSIGGGYTSESLIQNIYSTFTATSSELFDATDGKLFFKSINVIVPHSWQDDVMDKLKNKYTVEEIDFTFTDSDVRVDAPSPIHGKRPYTHQSRGCGHFGHYIHLTPSFFLRNNDKYRSKALLHQWAHFRFGVFDEFGYIGDKLFPPYYSEEDGDPLSTGCSNVPIEGDIFNSVKNDPCYYDLEHLLNSSCTFHPNVSDNESVKSSLMYLYDLPNVTSFCGYDSMRHIVEAPNAQNFHCYRKSVWEVIITSQDYASSQNKISTVPKLQMNLKKNSNKLKFILAADVSQKREHLSRARLLKIALNKVDPVVKGGLINVLKMIGYANVAEEVHQLVDLSRISNSNKSCIKCAVSKAIELSISYGTRNFVLVTDGIVNNTDIADIKRDLFDHNLKMFVILYPMLGDVRSWSEIAEKIFVINELNYLKTYAELVKALISVINSLKPFDQADLTVEAISENQNNDEYQKNKFHEGHFAIPNLTKLKYLIIIGDQPNANFTTAEGINYVQEGFEYSKPFYVKEIKLIGSYLDYKIKNANFLILLISEISTDLNFLGWTDSYSGPVNEKGKAIALYAELSSNYQPVINAKVKAIMNTYANKIFEKRLVVELQDCGNSEPDLIADDGIYSNYVINSMIAGTVYSIEIEIEEVDALIGTNRSWIDPNCCGSAVPLTIKTPQHIPKYNFNVGTFVVSHDVSISNFPPSRIIDLAVVKYDHSSQSLTLVWTAPGSIYQTGMVSEYEIGISNNRTEILMDDNIWKRLEDLKPSIAGTKESHDRSFSGTSGTYFVVIRAKNENNIYSSYSNVATVRINTHLDPRTTATIGFNTTVTEQPFSTVSGLSDERIPTKDQITLIISLSFVFALIVVVTVTVLCYCKIKRSKSEESSKALREVIASKSISTERASTGVDNKGFSQSRLSAKRPKNASTQTEVATTSLNNIGQSVNDLYAQPIPKRLRNVNKNENVPSNDAVSPIEYDESHYASSYF